MQESESGVQCHETRVRESRGSGPGVSRQGDKKVEGPCPLSEIRDHIPVVPIIAHSL